MATFTTGRSSSLWGRLPSEPTQRWQVPASPPGTAALPLCQDWGLGPTMGWPDFCRPPPLGKTPHTEKTCFILTFPTRVRERCISIQIRALSSWILVTPITGYHRTLGAGPSTAFLFLSATRQSRCFRKGTGVVWFCMSFWTPLSPSLAAKSLASDLIHTSAPAPPGVLISPSVYWGEEHLMLSVSEGSITVCEESPGKTFVNRHRGSWLCCSHFTDNEGLRLRKGKQALQGHITS